MWATRHPLQGDSDATTDSRGTRDATDSRGTYDDAGGRPVTDGGSSGTVTEERTLDGMRRTIARRLGESYRNAVHVTERREVDAEEVLDAVERGEGAEFARGDPLARIRPAS